MRGADLEREEQAMKTTGRQTEKDTLTPAQRWGELLNIIAMLLLCSFFVDHQAAQTGFFTATFGAFEMLCLYGPIMVSFIAPGIRMVTGRRNPARPFDVATFMCLALAALWLLKVFPFNFSHLADVFPSVLRFLLAWISNEIGTIFLMLQVILGPISAVATTWTYLSFRRNERAHLSEPQASSLRVSAMRRSSRNQKLLKSVKGTSGEHTEENREGKTA